MSKKQPAVELCVVLGGIQMVDVCLKVLAMVCLTASLPLLVKNNLPDWLMVSLLFLRMLSLILGMALLTLVLNGYTG